ncbi:hypothetical protein ACE1ET_19615 [Saccharicrinis sp. FJH62]|uniref:hypothetical protein n=1 Tax=Saccharicrinis sp. FJH62 TaxID=3344657 RepID=UPI0035D41045
MKNLILTTILCLFILPLHAQTESDNVTQNLDWQFSIGIVPQYAIISGMRLDFDLKLKQTQYLTLAPQMYYNENYTLFYPESTDMKGAGLNVNYRYIFSQNGKPEGPYVGAGLVYKYYTLKYWGDEWVDYVELGNTYSEQVNHEINQRFNQFGYDLLIGYQGTLDRFFFDMYLGWGFRLSDFDKDKSGDDFWSETVFDPGYSGFLPTIGFRVGLFLK